MEEDHIARVSTVIDAPVSSVWDALVNPETIKQYMFGTDVAPSPSRLRPTKAVRSSC